MTDIEVRMGVTVLMPCLNEVKTLGVCINKAQKALENQKLPFEILIADNGSTDGSIDLAKSLNARIINIEKKGYGSALRGGIDAAKYEYIIMGDADDSYDFSSVMTFINKLEEGYDLVMGNRFSGGIEPGAMSFSHRYIGNPVLSGLGRLFYRAKIKDFHCGMRAFRKSKIQSIGLNTTGMEFASEMVVKSLLFNLRVTEIPCKLYPDGRDRPPHLRSIPDGLRHLKFLLIYSPNWLFLYPGILSTIIGFILMLIIFIKPFQIANIKFEVITMFYAAMLLMLGVQAVQFSLFTHIYGMSINQFPSKSNTIDAIKDFMLKGGFILAAGLITIGLLGVVYTVYLWSGFNFGDIPGFNVHRIAILSGSLLMLGFQFLFCSFFVNVLDMGGEQ